MPYALLCTIDPSKLELFGRLRGDRYAFLVDTRTEYYLVAQRGSLKVAVPKR